MGNSLPLLAIVLSVAGFTLSLLNFLRDQARPRAWCEVWHYSKGPTPDDLTPAMVIRVINAGRRPTAILGLEIRGEGRSWGEYIKKPRVSPSDAASLLEAVKSLENQQLAQHSAQKLAEGEVVDLMYWPEDYRSSFLRIDFDEGVYATAEKIFIRDYKGRLSRVRGDRKALQVMDAYMATQNERSGSA